MEYNIWIEPDSSSGDNYLKFSGKVALNDKNIEWLLAIIKKVSNREINYVNPLFSSDPTSNSEISLGLLPISKSSE